MAKLPLISAESFMVEITDQCYTGCHRDYCYKVGDVEPNAPEVPLDIIKKRMDWINKYSDVPKIWLIGGEPLLHSNFRKIVEYVQSLEKTPHIITSGKVSKSKRGNLDYLIDLYCDGEIDIDLSLHPGNNLKEFENLFNRLNVSQNRGMRLYSTVTLDQRFKDFDKFEGIVRYVHDLTGENYDSALTNYEGKKDFKMTDLVRDEMYSRFMGQFTDDETFIWRSRLYDPKLFLDFTVRYFGTIGVNLTKIITPHGEQVVKEIQKQGGSSSAPCPGMTTTVGKQIRSHEFVIKTDGTLTFPQAQCIAACSALGNIDELTSRKVAKKRIIQGLEWLKTKVITTKALVADESFGRCKQDPKFPKEFLDPEVYKCVNCNFDAACNICATTSKIPSNPEEYIREWMEAKKVDLEPVGNKALKILG
jgi:hypothetical protein